MALLKKYFIILRSIAISYIVSLILIMVYALWVN